MSAIHFLCDRAAPNRALLQQVIPPRVCETQRHQSRYHATFWGLEQYSTTAPLLQSSSSDAVRHHVRVQFATICSRRADVRNLTSYVHLVLAGIFGWTSSYNEQISQRRDLTLGLFTAFVSRVSMIPTVGGLCEAALTVWSLPR